MAKRVSADRWLFGVTLLMVAAGLVMVFSASAIVAKARFGSESEFLRKQILFAVAGLAAMFAMMRLDYRKLNRQGLVFTVLGVTSVLLAAVFLLDRSHNTHRWIKLGILSFQPSELAKPAIILFMALLLAERSNGSTSDWQRCWRFRRYIFCSSALPGERGACSPSSIPMPTRRARDSTSFSR